jgi:predicted dehydrogenase
MAEPTRIGIIGGGWPGAAHAGGIKAAGGYKIVAVGDLIPQRRKRLMEQFAIPREYANAEALLSDKEIDAVSICLPTDLHASVASAAMRAGKHVVCESPAALDAAQARRMATAAHRDSRVLLYAMQRRFGAGEQAAGAAIAKGYVGAPYHVRASWMRARGTPIGTGWYGEKSRSGGGALIDMGIHMLDLAWSLLGEPAPVSVYCATHRRLAGQTPEQADGDVEESAFALLKFEGGQTLELSSAWSLNLPTGSSGTMCRVFGERGSIDVCTPRGAVLYQHFTGKGEAKATTLKSPKTVNHEALFKHFRQCITTQAEPNPGSRQGVTLMEMIDALYRSAESGKSVAIKTGNETRAASLMAKAS